MVEIPTTAQVRHGYSIADGGLNDTWLRVDAEKRFDHWIAEVKARAFAQGRDSQRDHAEYVERERIIKLLEKESVWLDSTGDEDNEIEANGMRAAIALIKGETE